jgi:hypothetical protein
MKRNDTLNKIEITRFLPENYNGKDNDYAVLHRRCFNRIVAARVNQLLHYGWIHSCSVGNRYCRSVD